MKIVHLTSAHPRNDARIFLKECRALAERHEVILVVADGRGGELRDGIAIIDVGRPNGRADRMIKTVNKVFRAALAVDADIYQIHDPELLIMARRLRKHDKIVIFDAHEDLPRQIMSKHWIPRLLRNLVSRMAETIENGTAKKLSGIIAATPHIAQRFARINKKVIDINNYPILDELSARRDEKPSGHNVCYIGGITHSRGIEVLMRALPMVPEVRLILCGAFQEPGLEDKVRKMPGWAQVDYLGHVGRNAVADVLAKCSVGIVTLFPTPAYLDSLPVKMFEYMSAELAVIASDFPLWRAILQESGAGICVDPYSPRAIANGIKYILSHPLERQAMGINGREAVIKKYNWSNESRKLLGFYDELFQKNN